MCGLIGYIGKGLSKEWLGLLLQSMAYRGPDGEGVYHYGSLSIGMRRLAVIDIEGGWQPLFSRGGRVVAFQNGEIYNYKELRRQLESRGYVFLTGGDTEVLAHGYDAWSMEGLLARIDGMYAIAIHDQDANELHLARDRFGEKPLFYSLTSDGFAFGSTLLGVSAMPWVTDSVHLLSLQRYLALHYVPGRRTVLQDVERVLPGERLTIALDGLRLQHQRYYRPCLKPARQLDEAELIEHVSQATMSSSQGSSQSRGRSRRLDRSRASVSNGKPDGVQCGWSSSNRRPPIDETGVAAGFRSVLSRSRQSPLLTKGR
jgi:asparagine synthase (glutamine-hydrolysing)